MHCFFILFVFFSCTKVIDIKVRDSDIQYLIEGVITNEPGICRVLISQTKNFNENNDFNKVGGAVVKVTDNGQEFILEETGPGEYSTSLINGTPGHVYALDISINGLLFSSTSVMPEPVQMDSLYIAKGPFGQFKFATIRYTDPAGINNGYRFVQYVNGVKEPTIFWEDDEFTDGQKTIMQLDASADEKDDPRNIKSGDLVMVEMQAVDDPVFHFWYSLRAGGGNGEGITASPANPVTNIQGGALGYFSAHTVNRKQVIAP